MSIRALFSAAAKTLMRYRSAETFLSKDSATGTCVACEICEDLWVSAPPSQNHAAAGAVIIVNLSASDETVGKAEYRRTLVKSVSGRSLCAYVYADAGQGESVTDCVFAGHCLIAENGGILNESALFSESGASAEIDAEFLKNERRRMTTFKPSVENYTRVFADFVGGSDLKTRQSNACRSFPKARARKREKN